MPYPVLRSRLLPFGARLRFQRFGSVLPVRRRAERRVDPVRLPVPDQEVPPAGGERAAEGSEAGHGRHGHQAVGVEVVPEGIRRGGHAAVRPVRPFHGEAAAGAGACPHQFGEGGVGVGVVALSGAGQGGGEGREGHEDGEIVRGGGAVEQGHRPGLGREDGGGPLSTLAEEDAVVDHAGAVEHAVEAAVRAAGGVGQAGHVGRRGEVGPHVPGRDTDLAPRDDIPGDLGGILASGGQREVGGTVLTGQPVGDVQTDPPGSRDEVGAARPDRGPFGSGQGDGPVPAHQAPPS
ncbi:hypothetical protein SHIRM173S_10196 [Streptomyces hirsutus]